MSGATKQLINRREILNRGIFVLGENLNRRIFTLKF